MFLWIFFVFHDTTCVLLDISFELVGVSNNTGI